MNHINSPSLMCFDYLYGCLGSECANLGAGCPYFNCRDAKLWLLASPPQVSPRRRRGEIGSALPAFVFFCPCFFPVLLVGRLGVKCFQGSGLEGFNLQAFS